jgi:FkbM family methyltransferase
MFIPAILLFFALINNTVFAQSKNNFIEQFIYPNCLIFDVGAHKGIKTDHYLSLGAKVVCFEPQPECADILREKYTTNKKVHIEQIGLSFKDDVLTFYIASDASTLSTFAYDWTINSRFSEHGYQWNKCLKIPVTTLDKMIKKHGCPHFCKIDVENYEYEVLQGLTQPIPYLSFEFTHEYLNKTEACVRYLQQLGYKGFNVAFGEKRQFLFTSWMSAEILLETLKKYCSAPLSLNEDPWGLWGDVYASYADVY